MCRSTDIAARAAGCDAHARKPSNGALGLSAVEGVHVPTEAKRHSQSPARRREGACSGGIGGCTGAVATAPVRDNNRDIFSLSGKENKNQSACEGDIAHDVCVT